MFGIFMVNSPSFGASNHLVRGNLTPRRSLRFVMFDKSDSKVIPLSFRKLGWPSGKRPRAVIAQTVVSFFVR